MRAFTLAIVMALVVAAAAVIMVTGAPAASARGALQARASTPYVVGLDLPLQGAAGDVSADTVRAIQLVFQRAGYLAGPYPVALSVYDDSRAETGGWDAAKCRANARLHVANARELAVIGTYSSGCTRRELPTLDRARNGPMAMVSHANTSPGLTRHAFAGEPGIYYPAGVRNFGRIIVNDDVTASVLVSFARSRLGVQRCYVLDDGTRYGIGIARAFRSAARRQHVPIVGNARWDPITPTYVGLWQGVAQAAPDCVFLGGIADNNGFQVIADKVRVLGSNEHIRLLAGDGFSGYPYIDEMAAAQGMFIAAPGIARVSVLMAKHRAVRSFVHAFSKTYGHWPVTTYPLYGAAVAQLMLKAVGLSDGTRRGVRDLLFSGLTVAASQSVVGTTVGIHRGSGDTVSKQVSLLLVRQRREVFYREVDLR